MWGTDGIRAGAWNDVISAAPTLVRRRLRTTLRRAGWRGAPRRGWVAARAPSLVAASDSADGDWHTESVTLSGTSVAVAVVGCRRTGRRRVVKLPCTTVGAESLRRQADVLTVLHRDPRLAGWRRVVPRHLGQGELMGHRYWVENAVPGTSVTGAERPAYGHDAVLAAAVRLIEDLHARTGEERILDGTDLEEWVGQPLRRLATSRVIGGHHEKYRPVLERIRGELSAALTDRPVRTSWIHGDFWPANLLVSGMAVTGVVDWDRARPHQLPLHDLLHLHVFARRAADGCELGDVLVRALRRGLGEAIGVPDESLHRWLDGLPERPAILLYWLRHISLFIESEDHGDDRLWLRRNVHNVLACA
jgi:aminoglycoside phosphotransferase (APT) family kinase protein